MFPPTPIFINMMDLTFQAYSLHSQMQIYFTTWPCDMQNNKTADQQLDIEIAVPEEPLELAQVLHQCKVHAVYSVLILQAPIICKLPKWPHALSSEGTGQGLPEPRPPVFAAWHSAARPSGGSSRAHCMLPQRNPKPLVSASSQLWHTSWMLHSILPGKEYKTDILSKLPTATCKQLHYNSKPLASECGTPSSQKSERFILSNCFQMQILKIKNS